MPRDLVIFFTYLLLRVLHHNLHRVISVNVCSVSLELYEIEQYCETLFELNNEHHSNIEIVLITAFPTRFDKKLPFSVTISDVLIFTSHLKQTYLCTEKILI